MLLRIAALVELLLTIFVEEVGGDEDRETDGQPTPSTDNDEETEHVEDQEAGEHLQDEEEDQMAFEISEKAIRIAQSIIEVSFGQLCK